MLRPTLQLLQNTKIAKRIFGLFALAAIVPIVLVAVIEYTQVKTIYEQDLRDELRGASKEVGLLTYERLINLKRYTELLSSVSNDVGNAVTSSQDNTHENIVSNRRVESLLLTGPTVQPDLLVHRGDYPNGSLSLYGEAADDEVSTIEVFTLNTDYLWEGMHDYDLEKHFVILTEDGELIFSTSDTPLVDISLLKDSEEYLHTWTLFLGRDFISKSWQVNSYYRDSRSLSFQEGFYLPFILTAFLALLLALLIGTYVVRKSTEPLDALVEGVKKIQRNTFDHRIEIKTHDEYSALGDSFNKMSSKLGRHISAIKSLAKIDAVILEQLKIEDLIKTILEMSPALFNAEAVFFLIPEGKEGEKGKNDRQFRVYCSRGYSQKEMANVLVDKQSEQVLHHPQGPYLSAEQPIFSFLSKQDRSNYIFSLGLKGQGVYTAFLLATFDREPEVDQMEIVKTFSEHMAVALKNTEWEEKLFAQARFDKLTQVPNRYSFDEELRVAIKQARSGGQCFYLLYLDIDHFKSINQSIGHSAADGMLKVFASRLETVVLDGSLYRLGADNFAIINFTSYSESHQIVSQVEKFIKTIREVFQSPIVVEGNTIPVTSGIGVTMFPFDSSSGKMLLSNAELALKEAKSKGVNQFSFYSSVDNKSIEEKILLIAEIKQALVNNEFELYYQPKVCPFTRKMDGCEALIRWNHPVHGLLSPFFFIPQAEESGLINDIGRWVFAEACRQQAKWLKSGIQVGNVSVNVSVLQFLEEGFHDDCIAALERADCPAQAIEIEITETAYVDDMDSIKNHLLNLRNLGMSFSVDDYGTGHSSLSLLLNLPINTIKIDKSFIDEIETSRISLAIVESTIQLSHKVGLKVVAEGIEEYTQLVMLEEAGCDLIQGYYFSKPVPADELVMLSFSDKSNQSLLEQQSLPLFAVYN